MRVAALALVVTATVTATAAPAQVRFARGMTIDLVIGDDAGVQAFALADIDADGDADLLTVADDLELCDAITVLRNRGDGTFETPQFYPDDEGDLVRPSSVLVADVGAPLASPADGNADVIAVTVDGVGVIAFGDGTGNFQLADAAERIDVSFDIDGEIVAAGTADFDGHNGADLALLDDGGFLIFLCNTGFGTFEACADYILATNDDAPLTLEVGDVDGNGNADVVVLDRGAPRNAAGSLTVFLGGGDGSFVVSPTRSIQPRPTDLAVGRIDADAIDDVVVAFIEELGGDSIQTFIGRASGTLMARPVINSLSFAPAALAMGDFDDDGVNDLVAPQAMGDDFFSAIMRGDGVGGFDLVSFTGNGTATGLGRAVAVADLDRDGHADFVVLRADGEQLRVAINVSDEIPTPTFPPTVTPSATVATATPTATSPATPTATPTTTCACPPTLPSATTTATASVSPTSTATAAIAAEDDGCAIDPSPDRGASRLLLVAAAWALVRRRLRRAGTLKVLSVECLVLSGSDPSTKHQALSTEHFNTRRRVTRRA